MSTGVGGALSLDMGLGDFGLGDFGLGDFGLGDFGLGDFGLGDFGLGDFGLGDFGLGDFGQGAPGESIWRRRLERSAAGAPNSLTAFLDWPEFMSTFCCGGRLRRSSEVATYEVFRVLGLPTDIGNATRVGIVTAPLTEFLDTRVQLAGSTYTYFVIAVSVEGVRSPHSNLAVIQRPLTEFSRPCAPARLRISGRSGSSRDSPRMPRYVR